MVEFIVPDILGFQRVGRTKNNKNLKEHFHEKKGKAL